jgi:peptidoglycan/LPS O-acetylase OafA/YrhL
MYPRRYSSLDAWRGAAALAVFLYHRFNTRVHLVSGFWLAVQLFFVVSGYCIAAAADEAIRREMGIWPFLKRRFHRIAPPYLASCLVAIVCRLFWKGLAPIAREWGMYLQNFAMLQWVSLTRAHIIGAPMHSAADNPRLLINVYWSLNYEEQFYLIAALLVGLALIVRTRAAMIAAGALTVAVAALNFARPGQVSGLFCDYWLQFVCGAALYYRLCRVPSARAARRLDLVLAATLGLCLIESYRRGELALDPHAYHFYGQLTICVAFACLLIVLRPVDNQLMRTPVGRLFGALGRFSYSLYLIHIPLMGVLDWFDKRIAPRWGTVAADLFVVSSVLLLSWVFYRLFEKPFLNRPLTDRAAHSPARSVSASQASAAP